MNPGNAGRPLDSMCDEFLARHSEYMDGRLPPLRTARLAAHASACASCARYDRVVRRGAELVRNLPPVLASDDFELRLQHRIFHMQDAHALARSRAAGATTVLGIAAAIALLAWSPLLVARSGGDTPAEAASDALRTSVAVSARGPLFDDDSWYPLALPHESVPQRSGLLAAFPGPYSPLVVTPPAHRAVRSVSSGYAPID